jgi:hypothetical protein
MNENDYTATPASTYDEPSTYTAQIDQVVRENPIYAILGALGVGIALGLLVRSLVPAQPENRALSLLEDIQERLTDLAEPAYRRVASVAEEGADVVRKGVDRLGDLHLERSISGLGRRFRNLFR